LAARSIISRPVGQAESIAPLDDRAQNCVDERRGPSGSKLSNGLDRLVSDRVWRHAGEVAALVHAETKHGQCPLVDVSDPPSARRFNQGVEGVAPAQGACNQLQEQRAISRILEWRSGAVDLIAERCASAAERQKHFGGGKTNGRHIAAGSWSRESPIDT
jgi:hypothetical protein